MSRELLICIAFTVGALAAIAFSILTDRQRIRYAIRHGYNIAVDQMTKGGYYYGIDGETHRVVVMYEREPGG